MDFVVISGKKYNKSSIFKEKEEYVRLEAVDLCFALTGLVDDESAIVRAAVARKKVGHDTLVNDISWRVRATVAKYTEENVHLSLLANDEHSFVRYIVAKKGHSLELLINDVDEEIASIARIQMQNKDYLG
jgi:hypothetical protein